MLTAALAEVFGVGPQKGGDAGRRGEIRSRLLSAMRREGVYDARSRVLKGNIACAGSRAIIQPFASGRRVDAAEFPDR